MLIGSHFEFHLLLHKLRQKNVNNIVVCSLFIGPMVFGKGDVPAGSVLELRVYEV